MNPRYVGVYRPGHPNAHKCGLIYEHRLVMSEHLGRPLKRNEVVHHIDENPRNNKPNNLELKTNKGHSADHRGPVKPRKCPVCLKKFKPPVDKTVHCSIECGYLSQRRAARPTKAKLKRLVWKFPTSELAKKLGVSDSAIGKWCKQMGIEKPPRGYWTRKRL